MFQSGHPGGTLGIVVGRGTAHVNDDVRADIFDFRIDVTAEIVHPFVLQPHTIEHSRSGFHHTRVVVALAGMQGGAFHDDAAQLMKWYKIGKLWSVAKRPGSGHHGILQLQSIYLYL